MRLGPICLVAPTLVAATLTLAACGGGTRVEDLNTTAIALPDGTKILAETMVRDMDLTRGMMFRDALPPGRGMILMFPKEDRHPAFTYNVRVPLDILWMDKDQRLVEISENLPPCTLKSAKACPTYGGKLASKYALELNGGGARAYRLKLGDKLSF